MDKFSYVSNYDENTLLKQKDAIKITTDTKIRINRNSNNTLVTYNCCEFKEGCCIVIDDNVINICHYHLFDLMDMFHKLVKEINEHQVALVQLMDKYIIVNKSKAIYIRSNIFEYMYNLFAEDKHSDLFCNKNMSDNQIAVVMNFSKRLERERFESEYLNQAHIGEINAHRISKEIIGKIQDCVQYNKILYYPEEKAWENPVTSLKVYSSMRNVICKAADHKKRFHSVITILDQRDDNFAFGFCQNCLYDFYSVLKSAYENKKKKVHKVKDFKVIRCESDEPCFFTGIHEAIMHCIYIKNISFYLCKSSFEMLFETIVNSAVFQELFPDEVKNYDLPKQKHEIWYKEHYDMVVADLELARENEVNQSKQLSIQNTALKKEIKQLNRQIAELKKGKNNESLLKISENVCNCLLRSNSINLSIKRKDAQNSKTPKFKVTYIYGADCATLDHFPKADYGIILEIERENEKFCFALCELCIKYINQGLSAILSKQKDFINDFVKFKIVPIRIADTHCYKCGGKHPLLYQISFANVNFTLCIDCIRTLSEQLTEASDKITTIKKLGGIYFLKNGVIDLTNN